EDRFEQYQTDVVAGRRAQRGKVVGLRKACARQERLERCPLRGLAGHRKRPRRPPVEALLEREHTRLAGCLAGVLDRRLVRLGAGIAEERLRATKPCGQRLRECRGGLGRVEVRHVPEAIELAVRGCERRWVSMTERN